jgi:hypothetical protein
VPLIKSELHNIKKTNAVVLKKEYWETTGHFGNDILNLDFLHVGEFEAIEE